MRLTLHDSLVTNANLELQVHYINKGDTLVFPLHAKRSNPHHDHYRGQTQNHLLPQVLLLLQAPLLLLPRTLLDPFLRLQVGHKGGADCAVDEPLHVDYRCILPHWLAASPARTVELLGHLPWSRPHSFGELTESSLQ